jgi:hypothetical protein
MGGLEGDVVKDEDNEYFKMVKVQWSNDQIWMNNIFMKIIGMVSGIVM